MLGRPTSAHHKILFSTLNMFHSVTACYAVLILIHVWAVQSR